MSVRDQLNEQIMWRAQSMASIVIVRKAFEGLGLLDADFYAEFGDGEWCTDKVIDGPYIRLEPRHVAGIAFGMTAEGPTIGLVDTTPTLGDAAKALLPKVGKWEKSFNDELNLIRLTGHYNGVRIVLQDTPPDTCTVRKVVEEVEIPEKVIVAHTEKKIRYVLEGGCDPLMTASAAQPVTGGAVEQEEGNGK